MPTMPRNPPMRRRPASFPSPSAALTLLAAASLLAAGSAGLLAQGAPSARRLVRIGDMYRLRNVGAPQLSPDGQWVAYTVTSLDSAKDKSNTDVWMTSWDGTQSIQLTSSPDAESSPRWSPDGRYLSFLSSRDGGKGAQLWLLERRGVAGHGAQERYRVVRLVAGQQAPRARHARCDARCRFGGQEAEADRHRPISFQG